MSRAYTGWTKTVRPLLLINVISFHRSLTTVVTAKNDTSKTTISFIPFSIEKVDNTLQEIAEMSIAAIVLSLLSSFLLKR